MINKLKDILPDNIKIIINKFRFPIMYLKYILSRKKYYKICNKLGLQFYNDVETVNKIINEKKSLSRFGDGEMLWMLNVKLKSYQDNSLELTNKLKEVIKDTGNSNLIIGIVNVYSKEIIKKFIPNARMHWTNFGIKYLKEIEPFLKKEYIYADALISRCYIDYKNKDYVDEKYSNLKRIWNDRDVLIVEGEKTKLGVGNDLFSNSKSIERLICPSQNAFKKYNEILDSIKKYGKDKIVLLALGPTATILAWELSKMSTYQGEYQAIDLGHIDIEYEWFKMKAKKRVAIPGKCVNEVRNKDLSSYEINNVKYESEIISHIR